MSSYYTYPHSPKRCARYKVTRDWMNRPDCHHTPKLLLLLLQISASKTTWPTTSFGVRQLRIKWSKPLCNWNRIGSVTWSESPVTVSPSAGADSRGLLNLDEPPPQRQRIFWTNSCREGAEFGEVNRIGWHEKAAVRVVETGLEELSLKQTYTSRVRDD